MTHRSPAATRSICALITLATIIACGRIAVRHEIAPRADLSGLRTYAWVPDPKMLSLHPLARTEERHARLMAAIERELAARGYEKATAEPDFRVRYAAYFVDQFSTKRRFDVPVNAANKDDNYWGPWGTNLHTYDADFKKGSLTIAILPPDSERWLWRGVAEGVMQESLSKEERRSRIEGAVRDMLRKFPSRR